MKRLLGTLVLFGCAAFAATSRASDQEGLKFELTPYIWAMGIDGKLTIDDSTAHFNRDFSDIMDNTDFGGSGLAVVSYNRFVAFAQYDYLSMSADGKARGNVSPGQIIVPPGTKVSGDLDDKIGTYAGGYRFDTFGKNWVDVMFGWRDLNQDLKLEALGQHASKSRNVGDWIVMLRPSFQISKNWRFNPTMSYGVAGDSDTTYELQPQIQYQFSDSFAARIGYRSLNYRVSEGKRANGNFNELDGDISGLILGVGWTFPTRKEAPPPPPPPPPKPVAPAPKPAPPPVAAAPKDSDGDGVPDDKDQCPGTPKGTRVGPHGCDCDVSIQMHFATNSADLTAADKEQLDAAAKRMIELHFVAGQADGYTDSTGEAEYNNKLSGRRAKVVVDYLASKGVDESRTKVVGHGEESPVADNKTAEGRAQNRRVVLRRTDCDTNG